MPDRSLAAASIEARPLAGRPSTLGGDVNDRDRVDVQKRELTAVAVDELGRWHLHELDPSLAVSLGALDRARATSKPAEHGPPQSPVDLLRSPAPIRSP